MKLLGKVFLFGVGFAAGYICKKKDVFGKICEKIKKEEIKKVIKDVEAVNETVEEETNTVNIDNDAVLKCEPSDEDIHLEYIEKVKMYNKEDEFEPRDDEVYPKIMYIPTDDIIVDKPKLHYNAIIIEDSNGEQDIRILNEDEQIIHAVGYDGDIYSFEDVFGEEYKYHLLHDDLADDNDVLVIDNEILHVYVLIQLLDGEANG